jgi:hypothetical protein
MIARFARGGALITASCSMALSMQAAALAADEPSAPLTLDKAFTAATGKTVQDQPAALRNCARFTGGAKNGSGGWYFDQPVQGAQPLAYVIGYIDTVNGKANSVLIGVLAGQLYRIDVNEQTAAGNFGPQDLQPPPAGVSGGLTGDGVRLTTPQDWRLASGALMVTGGPATRSTTFALTAVCLPPSPTRPPVSPPSSPSPSPSPSRPPAGTGIPVGNGPARPDEPSPSAPASSSAAAAAPDADAEATGTLPITGGPGGALAGLGLASVAAGLLAVAAHRRRDRVRFRA